VEEEETLADVINDLKRFGKIDQKVSLSFAYDVKKLGKIDRSDNRYDNR
jgi:hypothetical protein